MNVENHQNNSRPRPQAVPEVVSLSSRQNAGLASDSDIRRPIAAHQGVSASADAVHPVRKSAANNPQVIVEVAPQKPPVAASADRGKRIIVEMSPDVTPLHPKLSARRKSIGSQTTIVEVSPDLSTASMNADRNKVAPKLSAGRRSIGGQVIVEMSPDVTPLHPRLSKVEPKLSAGRRAIGGQVIVEVAPPDIPSTTASFNQSDRGRVAPKLSAGRRAISGQVIVEVSPDIPSTSVRNVIEPEIAPEVSPRFTGSARKERMFTKKVIHPEVSPDVSPTIAASSRRSRAVVPEMAPDLKPLISKAN